MRIIILSQRDVQRHVAYFLDGCAILNYANGTIIPTTRRFDLRCYVPPDEIPRVRHSLIPRIKAAGAPDAALSDETKKGPPRGSECWARTRPRGAARNDLPNDYALFAPTSRKTMGAHEVAAGESRDRYGCLSRRAFFRGLCA